MGVAQPEYTQNGEGFDTTYADDDVDTSRVFHFKHQSGEVASGTVLDMEGCAFLGKAAIKDRFLMAELYDMGQNILNEEKVDEETEKPVTKEEPGQEVEPDKVPHKQEFDTEKSKAPQTYNGNKEIIEVNNDQKEDKTEIVQESDSVTESDSASHSLGDQIESIPIKMSGVTGPSVASHEIAQTKNREESAATADTQVNNETKEPITAEVAEQAPNSYSADVIEETDIYISEDEEQTMQSPLAEAPETELAEQNFKEAADEASNVEWSLPENPERADVIDLTDSEGFIIPSEDTHNFPLIENRLENSEATHELKLPIEEVEKAVTLVAERIEELKDEQDEEVHQILDQIAQTAEEAGHAPEDIFEGEVDLTIEELDEELKELFIQLFEKLEVEYTPELVEVFVNLALKGGFSEAAEPKKNETIVASNDTGTHEVLQKMFRGLAQIKINIKQALLIGRSAVNLYYQSPLSI